MKKTIVGCTIAILCLAIIFIPIKYILEQENRESNSVPIHIENKTDKSVIAVIFAVPLTTLNYLNNAKIEKYKISPNNSTLISYYLGTKKDVNEVMVYVVAWKFVDGNETDILKSPPYLVKSFYNPEPMFMQGDKYGRFLELIIEDE